MVLPDWMLRALWPGFKIGPSSMDLSLGDTWLFFAKEDIERYKDRAFELTEELPMQKLVSDSYIINPGEFVLATSDELISIPSWYSAFVQARSGFGRRALEAENAGYVDAGFGEGNPCHITFEIFNASPFKQVLRRGQHVAQLIVVRMADMPTKGYSGSYANQIGATGSRIHLTIK